MAYQSPIIFFLFFAIFLDSSQAQDSSNLIFNDSQVFKYEIEFYIENWEEVLKKNYPTKEYLPAKFTYGDIALDSVGIRYKGNSSFMMSQHTPKKPLKIKFDKFKKQTFFSLKKLNFSNCYRDPSFMREMISYEVARRYMPAPRCSYANIYIEGALIGLYVQVEQIDKLFLSRFFPDNDFNLYKVGDDGGHLDYQGPDQTPYEKIYELKTNESENNWSGFIAMLERLNNSPDSLFVLTMKDYLNIDLCLRHLAFNMVFSHFDSYTGSGRNYYFYDDSTSSQFQMLIWDLNETFGAYSYNWNPITQDIIAISNLDKKPLNRRCLENDSLKQVYLRYIDHMIKGSARADSIAAKVDFLKPLIQEHVSADTNKLYHTQHFIDNIEKLVHIGGSIGSFQGIKSFAQDRNKALHTQLEKYLIPISLINSPEKNTTSPIIWSSTLPHTSATTISYRINGPKASVRLTFYNCRGGLLRSVSRGIQSAGTYNYHCDPQLFSPGYYIVNLEYGNQSIVGSIFLLH